MIRSKTRTLLASEELVTLGDFLGFVESYTTVIIKGNVYIGGNNISNTDFGLSVNIERTLHFDCKDNAADNLFIRAHQGDFELTVFAY